MRIAAVMILMTQLSGCWFVFIPGGVIDRITGDYGNLCAREGTQVGQRVTYLGTPMVIRRVVGPSSKCPNPVVPVLVDAALENEATK